MNDHQKILALVLLAFVILIGAAFFLPSLWFHPGTTGATPGIASLPVGNSPSAAAPLSGNAFVPATGMAGTSGGGTSSGPNSPAAPATNQPSTPNAGRATGSAPATATTPVPAAPTAQATATSTPTFALPNIPDSEIAISSSGVATTMGYLIYLSTHPSGVSFDPQKFSAALKQGTSTPLFIEDLISKAVADDNFSEISSSLLIHQGFINAEINFLKSIGVTGNAVTLDKETIGFEELTLDLINNALAVGSGKMSESDFLNYYQEFNRTASLANQQLLGQVGLLPSPSGQSWLVPTAFAQGAGVPFGGPIVGVPIDCLCDFGLLVIIGPPVPAQLFVSYLFLETPLFFLDKSLLPGSYWLGLYNPLAPIPCAELPVCEPIDVGGPVILTGTSLGP